MGDFERKQGTFHADVPEKSPVSAREEQDRAMPARKRPEEGECKYWIESKEVRNTRRVRRVH